MKVRACKTQVQQLLAWAAPYGRRTWAVESDDLRHTSVSLLIELGAHPKLIQERLGHSSITVTMDVYGHLFPSLTEAITERLDEVFVAARSAEQKPTGEVRSLR